MDWIEVVVASGIVAIGATLQGSVGFGLGMFGAPLLILLDPRLVPAPLLCASVALTLMLTHRERRSIAFGDLKWALLGRVFGVAIAAGFLALVSRERIALVFGILVLVAVGISISGIHLRPTSKTLVLAGTISGFMGTSVSIGGPPMALVYQHQSGPRIRGTLSAYFTVGVALSLGALHLVGRFGMEELLLAFAFLPGVVFGLWLSRHTARVLDRGYTRPAVLLISAAAAVIVVVKHAF